MGFAIKEAFEPFTSLCENNALTRCWQGYEVKEKSHYVIRDRAEQQIMTSDKLVN